MKDKIDYSERLKEDYKKWDTIWKTGWSDIGSEEYQAAAGEP